MQGAAAALDSSPGGSAVRCPHAWVAGTAAQALALEGRTASSRLRCASRRRLVLH
jgi:hypothetical protein